MQERIAPSETKAQELWAMLQGQSEGQSGEELLSTLVPLQLMGRDQEIDMHPAISVASLALSLRFPV